uniref:SLBP_RNA_bind domain-containing protein n=1 Tax=Elaeophora elaphi TaxID=1147741 RepID=A0A0R3RXP5_9BILA
LFISFFPGSFDESYGDGEAATNVDCLRIEKSDNSGSKHSPLTGRRFLTAVPPLFCFFFLIVARSNIPTTTATEAITAKQTSISLSSNLSPYNVHLFTTVSAPEPTVISTLPPVTSVTPSASPQIAVTPPVARALFTTPQTTAPTKTTFQPLLHAMAPTSSTVQSASASLMMHFKNLVNVCSSRSHKRNVLQTFNSFTNSNGTSGVCPSSSTITQHPEESRRLSLDNNAISLQFQRSPTQFSTDHNAFNDKKNETATNLNDSKASIRGNNNSNTDQEKELRRQRRLRRRSVCQEMFPFNESAWKNTIRDPETGRQIGKVDETTRTVKKCTSEKYLLNNGVEVTSSMDGKSQAMEDAKWHILNLRRKRYQFLGLAPSPPHTAMQS